MERASVQLMVQSDRFHGRKVNPARVRRMSDPYRILTGYSAGPYQGWDGVCKIDKQIMHKI